MMTFEWNEDGTAMCPVEVDEEPFGEYDILVDDFIDAEM